MNVYINSRGRPNIKDYCWLNDKEEKIHNSWLDDCLALIDSTSPVFALYHYQNSYWLFITRIESDRKDYTGRKIRSSLVLQTDTESGQQVLRNLLIVLMANLDDCLSEIDTFINESNNNAAGFKFDKKILDGFLIKESNTEKVQQLNPRLRESKIAHLSLKRLEELTELIKSYQFPVEDGLLLWVGEGDIETLDKEENLWRVLCPSEQSKHWRISEVVSERKKRQSVRIKLMIYSCLLIMLLLPVLAIWNVQEKIYGEGFLTCVKKEVHNILTMGDFYCFNFIPSFKR